MPRILLPRILLPIAMVIVISACASTRAVTEWQDETYTGRPDSVLVIAAVEDGARRRNVEDAYVEEFGVLGIAAAPAYALMGGDSSLSRETVEAAIEGRDIDAVLVTRLLGVEEIEQYQPPTQFEHYRSYHRYYSHSLRYSSPGYYRKYNLLTLETTLYDTATGKLVWSMQSESIDPQAPQDLIDAQIELTVERLGRRGLLPAVGE